MFYHDHTERLTKIINRAAALAGQLPSAEDGFTAGDLWATARATSFSAVKEENESSGNVAAQRVRMSGIIYNDFRDLSDELLARD